MPPADAADDVDIAHLHQALRALANPVRLQLLRTLRVPRKPGDVRVQATDEWGRFQADRALSRSTVYEHLAVLEELGLVQHLPGREEVVVNQQRMFSLVSDLGALARLRPVVNLDVEHTVPARHAPSEAMPAGPKLILVTGPESGSCFALEGGGPWTVGRGAEAHVRLAYDPHVSRVQAVVTRGDDGLHWVEGLAGATNPAHLDFRALPPGRAEPLIPGSVLEVGSSRFVFKGV